MIGTLLVVLAHVNSPRLLSEIRSFDVALLVFISGMSMTYSTYNSYCSYLKKRIIKLCIPTYITICVVLTLLLVGSFISKSFSISLKYIFNSFFLIDGNSIGFVWIVKVYLFIAFLAPVIKAVVRKIESPIAIFIATNVLMIGMSILITHIPYNIIAHEYLIYAVQYSAVAVIGLSYVQSSRKQKITILILSACIFGISQIMIGFFSPSEFKYPPQYYYLAYGIFVSVALHIFLSTLTLSLDDTLSKLISWMSKNSFTIYICHIYLMWGYFLFGRIMPNVTSKIGWFPLYLSVSFGACVFCKVIEIFKIMVKN